MNKFVKLNKDELSTISGSCKCMCKMDEVNFGFVHGLCIGNAPDLKACIKACKAGYPKKSNEKNTECRMVTIDIAKDIDVLTTPMLRQLMKAYYS